jgi:hypothetical protein
MTVHEKVINDYDANFTTLSDLLQNENLCFPQDKFLLQSIVVLLLSIQAGKQALVRLKKNIVHVILKSHSK